MFITPIFVINLEKSTDRKAYMQAQFEQLFSNNLIQEIHFLMLFMENQIQITHCFNVTMKISG